MNEISELEDFTGWPSGSWVWCLHCERCYKVGEYKLVVVGKRKKEVFQLCPYADCDGDWEDAYLWDFQKYGEPERGKVYPWDWGIQLE
jgi:hypothetical protein